MSQPSIKEIAYNAHYPSIEDLRQRAKQRIPKFAFEFHLFGTSIYVRRSCLRSKRRRPYHLHIKDAIATSDGTGLL